MVYNGACNYLNSLPDANAGIEAHRTKFEFVVTANIAMNTAARYADIVLPVSTMWERAGELAAGTRETVYWWQNIIEPMYEAKTDYFIGRGVAERLGIDPNLVDGQTDEQRAYNTLAGAMVVKDDGSGYEPLLTITDADIKGMGAKGTPQRGRIDINELQEQGVYQVKRAPNDVHMLILHKAFREDPEANPLGTSTGKLEIYSQALAGAVNAWGYSEISPIGKWQPSDYMGSEAARKNPDYPLMLFTPHTLRRPHTVMDNVPYLREAFQQECFMSEPDAEARGLKTGDVVLIRSEVGKVIRHVKVMPGMIPGSVALQDGPWIQIDEATGIDHAGNPNILQAFPPTGQGYQTWTGTLIQVEKYDGELIPDHLWAPRRVDFPQESEA
jgi:anaerobic dimethyl sulfoxide reductase subunit A